MRTRCTPKPFVFLLCFQSARDAYGMLHSVWTVKLHQLAVFCSLVQDVMCINQASWCSKSNCESVVIWFHLLSVQWLFDRHGQRHTMTSIAFVDGACVLRHSCGAYGAVCTTQLQSVFCITLMKCSSVACCRTQNKLQSHEGYF